MLSARKQPRPKINKKQRMSEKKVTDTFDIEDLDKNKDKISFCRCWRSSKVNSCYASEPIFKVSNAHFLIDPLLGGCGTYLPYTRCGCRVSCLIFVGQGSKGSDCS